MHISCYDTININITITTATILESSSTAKLFMPYYYYYEKKKKKRQDVVRIATLTASSLQRMITEQIVIHGPSRSERRINAVDTMSCSETKKAH